MSAHNTAIVLELGLLQARWSLPFLRQANKGMGSFNHLGILTEGLMRTKVTSFWFKFSNSPGNSTSSSHRLLGAGYSQKNILTFLSPSLSSYQLCPDQAQTEN